MVLRDAAEAVKSLRKLLASERRLRRNLEQQGVTEKKRARLQADLAAVEGGVLTAVATFNAWAANVGGQPLQASQLWDKPEAATEALLAGMQKMLNMERKMDCVTSRLEPPIIPAFGCGWQLLRGMLAVVVVALFGWLAVLFYICGFPAYTFAMRNELFTYSFLAWLLLVEVRIGFSLLPTQLAVGAALVAGIVATYAAAAAVESMLQYDLTQREEDIAQLTASRATAREIAAAGGSLASLARAMAGRLQETERRAQDALNAIRRQQRRLSSCTVSCSMVAAQPAPALLAKQPAAEQPV